MLKASEARKIAQNYNNGAAQRMQNHIEELIEQCAEEGMFWLPYNYNPNVANESITHKDVVEIVYNLREAGYDVKDNWFTKNLIICW